MKKFLRGLGNTLFIIFLFLGISSLLILIPIRKTMDKNVVREIITTLDIEKMIQENPNIQKSVEDMLNPIYEETRKFGIDDEIIIKIMNSKEVKGLIGDVTSNIIDAALTGSNQKILSNDSIANLVKEAISDINNSGFYEISPSDSENIVQIVKDTTNELEGFIPDTSIIEDSLNEEQKNDLKIIRFIFGNQLTTYIGIIVIIMILLLCLINFKEFKGIKITAITILTSSTLFTIASTIFLLLLNMFTTEEFAAIAQVLKKTGNLCLSLSGGITILMIALLITYRFIRKQKEKQNFQEMKKA